MQLHSRVGKLWAHTAAGHGVFVQGLTQLCIRGPRCCIHRDQECPIIDAVRDGLAQLIQPKHVCCLNLAGTCEEAAHEQRNIHRLRRLCHLFKHGDSCIVLSQVQSRFSHLLAHVCVGAQPLLPHPRQVRSCLPQRPAPRIGQHHVMMRQKIRWVLQRGHHRLKHLLRLCYTAQTRTIHQQRVVRESRGLQPLIQQPLEQVQGHLQRLLRHVGSPNQKVVGH
mmetsp:Transcript_9987/g.31459  ORF Transcript_9987/g.31459 Transcript_9987/m.31459 type:complete len:222 (-) Transcript_9987:330-995(-)